MGSEGELLEKPIEDACEFWCEGFRLSCEKKDETETEPHSVKEDKDVLLTLCQRTVHKRKRAGLCNYLLRIWEVGDRMRNFAELFLVLKRLKYAEVQWAGEVFISPGQGSGIFDKNIAKEAGENVACNLCGKR